LESGCINEVLQSHHFRLDEKLETALRRYVWLYNQQLPQSALGSKAPLQAMKEWNKLRQGPFRKQPYAFQDVTPINYKIEENGREFH